MRCSSYPFLNLRKGGNKERFFSGNSIELIPITMAILYLCQGDVSESMIEVVSFGRDCDTTANMAGAIAGAMHGASAIRPDWIETVERANEDFFVEVEGNPQANFRSMAERLTQALHAERDRSQRGYHITGLRNRCAMTA